VEGPYRDLGSGFARLTGVEGARRGPSRIRHVEDALEELLRNARDAGARNVCVASTLKGGRYRILTVLDDGHGIPEPYKDLIFEPGVTTRHLRPVHDAIPHGAGLSLYHIRKRALTAELPSASSPTAIKFTFDTQLLPERALQSGSRPSKSNLLATLQSFAQTNHPTTPPNLYYGPPARILATLLKNHIIHIPSTAMELTRRAGELGLEVSLRTAQRIRGGEIEALRSVSVGRSVGGSTKQRRRGANGGAVLVLGEEEKRAIADILRRAAGASYLELGELRADARAGEISIRARVHEPEEEYE
jgi:hypothetical protein